MDGALIELIAASVTLVGTHFVMSHPLRAPLVRMLGELGFMVVYSLVSIAAIVWIYFAFKAAPAGDLPGTGEPGWIIATALTLPAMVLFAGSMAGNPAMPSPQAAKQARAEPRGAFTITRHPMMWGFGLWAVSHIVLWFSWRSIITAAAILILALVGAHLQDRKKRALMGEAWTEWESRTSFWPRISGFAKAGALPWALGLIFFVLFSWLHLPIGNIPAGIWLYF